MIDIDNLTIRALTARGYKIAAHAYLQPDGETKYTYVAHDPQTGHHVQGWSMGGDLAAALADLERRAAGLCAG